LNLIKNLMASEVEFIVDEQRLRPEKSEVNRLWCDNGKIFSLTGFAPQVSLQEGLQRTITWFCNPDNLKHYKTDRYNV
ncbi:MAG: NAD-dependent dehydratase, partial [Methylomonas sp.]